MKRSPLNKIGRIGKANKIARDKIAEIAEEMNLRHCELQFTGCKKTMFLAPAHKHKRIWYKGNAELLADPQEWICACVVCHDVIEKNPDLTEDVFDKLRPPIIKSV